MDNIFPRKQSLLKNPHDKIFNNYSLEEKKPSQYAKVHAFDPTVFNES